MSFPRMFLTPSIVHYENLTESTLITDRSNRVLSHKKTVKYAFSLTCARWDGRVSLALHLSKQGWSSRVSLESPPSFESINIWCLESQEFLIYLQLAYSLYPLVLSFSSKYHYGSCHPNSTSSLKVALMRSRQ